ncbi:hypothetical protein EK904_002254, partial [Melospiza melodia maxima]
KAAAEMEGGEGPVGTPQLSMAASTLGILPQKASPDDVTGETEAEVCGVQQRRMMIFEHIPKIMAFESLDAFESECGKVLLRTPAFNVETMPWERAGRGCLVEERKKKLGKGCRGTVLAANRALLFFLHDMEITLSSKLIDTIASEIGELKQEMVQTDPPVEDESTDWQSLIKDMDNISPEKNDVKSCPRDSGYDSLSNKLSILDKLLHTHSVWLQLGLNDAEALEILQTQPPGIFLVRKSARLQRKVISLRVSSDCGSCLKEFAIKESTYSKLDVLPFTLKLPHAISAAKTEAELEEIAQLGLNFWSSLANSKPPDPSPPCRPVPLDSARKDSRQLCLINGVHSIRTRTPSELECSQTNGALCFINPLFLKVHSQDVSGSLKRQSPRTPDKRMIKKIAELSRDKRTYFGCLVQDYVSFLQENKECHVSSTDMLQTIRQFMTQVKNYLSQSSELDPPIESLIPEDQIDVVLEKAMHKCILKPLKGHIEAMLKEFHTTDGSWKQLKENLQLVRQRNPQELGVFVPTPDFVDVEKIKVKFMTMQKMYSPEKKVMLLLRVCKLIYTVMENNSGRLYGADDFLPVLTYVLAQCDMLELDTEIEYMMELLDPSLLHGEGGYYLTSAYGALSLIKNFQEEQAAQLLSSEARDTLRQWHKRRTTNRTIPSVDDFQNYLRVAFQEVTSGCTGKTLLVRPYITTEDVCQLCAEKFKVANPEEYRLFLFIDDTWQQLTEDTYPQKIKAELHSRPLPQVFHFVYKRLNSDPYGAILQNSHDSAA